MGSAPIPNLAEADAPKSDAGAPIAATLTAGFGAAVLMWMITWVLHLPGITAPPLLAFGLMAVGLVGAVALAASRRSRGGVALGGAAGLLCGLINLMMLGSVLASPAESVAAMDSVANDLRENALPSAVLFLGVSGVLGAAGGFLGSLVPSRSPDRSEQDASRTAGELWLARFAMVTLVSFVPLLAIGGAVTSKEAGLSVPEGVNSYGSIPFLLPLSVMAEDPRIYVEHTHRLFGWLVGLTVLTLCALTWVSRKPMRVKVLATVLLLLVSSQGMLGIYRVNEGTAAAAAGDAERMDHIWAMLHGILGQFVFGAAAIVFAVLAGPNPKAAASLPIATKRAATKGATFAHIAAVLLVLQLLTGAAVRHIGDTHAGWTHVGLSVFTAALIAATGMILASAAHGSAGGAASRVGRMYGLLGRSMIVVVLIQFLLGWVVLWAAPIGSRGEPAPDAAALATTEQVPLLKAIIPTVHQTIGALLIAFVALSINWTSRIKKELRRAGAAGVAATPGADDADGHVTPKAAAT